MKYPTKQLLLARNRWRDEQPSRCMNCKASGMVTLDVHEIVRRSRAPMSWCCQANFLLVCRQCHDLRFPNMPVVNQLVIKLLKDPDCFDLEVINDLIQGEPIKLRDVIKYLRLELGV
jgi:5-methylcytosine-specific restriction endonuclease McrA